MMKDIPIFICNFNRFGPTKRLVESLLSRNYTNIIILDNASEYPALLEWYATCPAKVHRFPTNEGQGTLKRIPDYQHIINNQLYVYSDSDVIPVDEAPVDFIDHMAEIMREKHIPKLGLSLKYDDLPDCYKHKQEVMNHESVITRLPFFDHKYCRIYKFPVDTTFAVCGTPLCDYDGRAWRTGWPYSARHAPWYYDSNNLPEDEQVMRAKSLAKCNCHWSAKGG